MKAGERRSIVEDGGTAVLEFVLLAVVVLIPLCYSMLVVTRLQAATFGTVTAARAATRAYVTADSPSQAPGRAKRAAALALADQGFGPPALTITCAEGPCLSPGSRVHIEVVSRVDIPFVPTRDGSVRGTIPVTAVHESDVDKYRSAS